MPPRARAGPNNEDSMIDEDKLSSMMDQIVANIKFAAERDQDPLALMVYFAVDEAFIGLKEIFPLVRADEPTT
jgi:hypothetical protein